MEDEADVLSREETEEMEGVVSVWGVFGSTWLGAAGSGDEDDTSGVGGGGGVRLSRNALDISAARHFYGKPSISTSKLRI